MADNKKPKRPSFNLTWIYVIVAVILGYVFFMGNESLGAEGKEVGYSQFKRYIENGWCRKVVMNQKEGTMKLYAKPDHAADIFGHSVTNVGTAYVETQGNVTNTDNFITQLNNDSTYLAKNNGEQINLEYNNASEGGLMSLLISFGPLVIIIVFWIIIMRRMGGGGNGGGMGSNIFNVGRSKAKLVDKEQGPKVTFNDVAGQAGAKQEVQEIVEFLKNSKKYTELGGKIPKGALLVGPPGTGKTLLAKAVAGEADVPFFSMSGSDFVEMFVGVGASRVRDLFRQAKEKSPCIIFIDEIDAIGRARGKNPSMGGNDERESTLNQLLTEMDGFGTNSGVIILAATNRADILDKALLRAGRFDRQIHVDLPDLPERKAIFNVHLRNIKKDDTLDVDFLARQTPGFSGADIANVCNEAALIAARHDKKVVSKEDFLAAVDRIIGGLEKKTKVMTTDEKRAIALHEAGHATISWNLQYANPLVKVTIVPRGRALGAAWYLPEERQINTREQMLDEICSLLGGRAAEELFTGHISSGAMNDLERVTKQVYAMIAYMGMSDKLPNLCYYNNEEYGFQKPYSDETAKLIDEEARRMIAEQYERAKALLLEKKEGHNQLAQILMEREVIYASDVEQIFGKRPWASRTEELLEENEQLEKETPAEPQAEEVPETEITGKDLGGSYDKSGR